MIHIGEHIYGVVDQVPGVMHVATRILHFNFIPCFPIGTVIVVDKRVAGVETTVKTSFSFKSLFFGYFRLIALVLSLWFLLDGTLEILRQNVRQPAGQPWIQSEAFWTLVTGAVGLLVYSWSFRWSRASYPRAIQLAEIIAVNRDVVDESFVSRGLTIGDQALPTTGPSNAERDDVYRLE